MPKLQFRPPPQRNGEIPQTVAYSLPEKTPSRRPGTCGAALQPPSRSVDVLLLCKRYCRRLSGSSGHPRPRWSMRSIAVQHAVGGTADSSLVPPPPPAPVNTKPTSILPQACQAQMPRHLPRARQGATSPAGGGRCRGRRQVRCTGCPIAPVFGASEPKQCLPTSARPPPASVRRLATRAPSCRRGSTKALNPTCMRPWLARSRLAACPYASHVMRARARALPLLVY